MIKTVILAGGMGYRLSDDSERIPKPLTPVGGIPILEHIMNIYGNQGFNDFIICLGYKGELIKRYFRDYEFNHLNVEIKMNGLQQYIRYDTVDLNKLPNWDIKLIDTGLNIATGSRIKKIQKYINDEFFFLTYGDGLSNIQLNELLDFHKSHNKLVTVSISKAIGQFGIVEIDKKNKVINFQEKPFYNANMSIGFMVVNPEIFDYIGEGDDIWWEKDILPLLVKQDQVMAYEHKGKFKCLDSPKDKIELEEMWNSDNAFWSE